MDFIGVKTPKSLTRWLPFLGIFTLVMCALGLAVLSMTSNLSGDTLLAQEDSLFKDFESAYGKTYLTEEERNYRKGVFRENLKRLPQHQHGNPLASFGVTKFSDMTPEEFKKRYAARKSDINLPVLKVDRTETSMPSDWDLRSRGVVRPVEDEGSCASHYAISVASALETLWALEVGNFLLFSEQQIIDCVDSSQGCEGGDTVSAFEYAMEGLQPKSSYQTTGVSGECSTDAYYTLLYSDAVYMISPNESSLQQILYTYGAISVTLSVDDSFMQYTGGILNSCGDGTSEVSGLLVGYGFRTLSWSYYWVVQMSFGAEFGNGGAVYLLRDPSNEGDAVCGLTNKALLPFFNS